MDTVKLACQAGATCDDSFESVGHNPMWLMTPDELSRFAALVVEECAKVCEEQVNGYNSADTLSSDVPWEAETKGELQMATQCAREVRSLIKPRIDHSGAMNGH